MIADHPTPKISEGGYSLHSECKRLQRCNDRHSAGFCTEHSAKARGIGYEEERSPTLRAGVTPAVLIYDTY